MRLRRILYAAAFLRALAVGLMAVLIGLHCARLGLSAAQIGIVLSAALWGAALAGVMMQTGGLGLPLIFAGVMKIAYDVLLWREFRRVKPPEERPAEA